MNLVIEDTVFAYNGLGPPMSFTHTYNADPSTTGIFGNGWSFSYDEFLTSSYYPGKFILFVNRGSGQGVSFSYPDPGGLTIVPPIIYSPEGGHFDHLTAESGHVIYEPKGSHTQYRFEAVLPPIVCCNYTGSQKVHLVKITDANGNEVLIDRDTDATIKTVTDAAGRVTTFSYSMYGGSPRCTLMTTPDGRTAAYSYDGSGNLIQSTDLLGTVTSYTYDADNFLTSLTVAGATTGFTYSGSGSKKRIATVTDAEGHVVTYAKNASQPFTSATDDKGNTFTYLSSSARPKTTTRVTDPLGNETTTIYGPSGPTKVMDGWGHQSIEYDDRGNMTRLERSHGHISTYTYDTNDNLLTSTDAYGNTWTYQYNGNHNLLKRISPMGRETVMDYDGRGQLVSITDPGGNTTTSSYDAFGNVLTTRDALFNVTSFAYDAHGLHLLSKTDPQNRTTTYDYDANDRVTKITYDNSSSVQYKYDEAVLISRTDEAGVVFRHQHNKLLATSKVIDGMGNYTAYGYDAAGNMVSRRDPRGSTSTYGYDGNGKQITSLDPQGQTQSYGYDERGLLTGFTNERNNTSNFRYDGNRFLTGVFGPPGFPDPPVPGGSGPSYIYDKAGRISSRYSARSNTTQTYTDDGQLDRILHNGSLAGTFSYDTGGNMAGYTDWAGTTSFTRDSLNRVTGITFTDNLSVSYTLLPDGLPEIMSYPGGLDISYTYDKRRHVTSISWPGGSLAMTYDPVGRVTAINRSNGTSSSYSYDANGRITRINHVKNGSAFAAMTYKRDASGNVTTETVDLPLLPDIEEDDINNTFNSDNQFKTFNGQSCSYDSDGNLTTVNGTRKLSASYDAENRLSNITLSSINSIFSYNLPGQRTRIEKNSMVRNLHPDNQNRLLFETDSGNSVTALFIYSAHRPLVMLRNGETYFYHYNQRGSTVALTDSTGTVAAAYTYSPFGRILSQNGTIENPFTWLGGLGVMDDGDGIYFMTNRHYDAFSGRFLQKDPAGFLGGHNLYAYVGNNPVNIVDPLGLSWRGELTATGNLLAGFLTFSASAAALATAPTWGTGLLCGASAVFAISRFYGTLKNIQGYLDPEYDTWDAGADIIDPTRVGRDSVFPWAKEVYWGTLEEYDSTMNTLGSSYGKLRSSTMDIAFPEFTIPEFTLD